MYWPVDPDLRELVLLTVCRAALERTHWKHTAARRIAHELIGAKGEGAGKALSYFVSEVTSSEFDVLVLIEELGYVLQSAREAADWPVLFLSRASRILGKGVCESIALDALRAWVKDA